MWEGVCGSSGAGLRERAGGRERERDSVSLGRDIHKWIKRALVLYKHRNDRRFMHRKCTQGCNYNWHDPKHIKHTHTHTHTRVGSCGNKLCSTGM